jgi:exonuclease VII small subunit
MTSYYTEACERLFKARSQAGFPPCTDQDVAAIEAAVQHLERCGATLEEAVRYVKCMEEYNPHLTEAVALNRMQKVQTTVEARTGKKWQYVH